MKASMLSYAGCPEGIREVPAHFAVTSAAIGSVCDALAKGQSLQTALQKAEEVLESGYKGEMFSFCWMKQEKIRDMMGALNRAFSYILEDSDGVVASDVACVAANMPTPDGLLTHKADMIIHLKSGQMAAVIINQGECSRSMAGRSLATSAEANPRTLCVKAYLERRYPNILIYDVYLEQSGDEPGKLKPFLHTRKRDTQMHILDYAEYRKGGAFDETEFLEYMAVSVTENMKPDCFLCEKRELCKSGARVLNPQYEVEEATGEKSFWQLPEYTESQKKVIEHGEGNCLVVAGPGSGKTATLVGRIHHLITRKDVPAEFILAVTFARDAAKEIRDRCDSILEENTMPDICTLNAFGYRVLKSHKEIVGDVRLLTDTAKLQLIESILDSHAQCLSGFSYGMKTGKQGLLRTVARRLDLYEENREGYFEKYGKDEGFLKIAKIYQDTIAAGGLITYNQQLMLCVELFKAHPEILRLYQQLYWYILVDEYQDINKVQYELIQMLAKGHGNLMAIGDDDQAVYGFRGGDSRFMLDFQKNHPESVYRLTENFRSSREIVSQAGKVFEGMENGRIAKEVVSAVGGGEKPFCVEDGDLVHAVIKAVKRLLTEGFKPDDIAVLSWKNATLEQMVQGFAKACIPAHIEKEYLCDSPFFLLLRDVLRLCDGMDEKVLKEYFSLFAVPVPMDFENRYKEQDCLRNAVVGDVQSAVSILKHLTCICTEHPGMTAGYFVDYAAGICGYAYSKEKADISEHVKDRNIRTMPQLLQEMDAMIRLRDEKRVSNSHSGKVLLTTAHEAKGREWECVVIADDFGTKQTQEVSRLLYVAQTRAKKRLAVARCSRDSLIAIDN